MICPICNGTGYLADANPSRPCGQCNGSGWGYCCEGDAAVVAADRQRMEDEGGAFRSDGSIILPSVTALDAEFCRGIRMTPEEDMAQILFPEMPAAEALAMLRRVEWFFDGHVESPSCWCRPYEDEEGVWIHQDPLRH